MPSWNFWPFHLPQQHQASAILAQASHLNRPDLSLCIQLHFVLLLHKLITTIRSKENSSTSLPEKVLWKGSVIKHWWWSLQQNNSELTKWQNDKILDLIHVREGHSQQSTHFHDNMTSVKYQFSWSFQHVQAQENIHKLLDKVILLPNRSHKVGKRWLHEVLSVGGHEDYDQGGAKINEHDSVIVWTKKEIYLYTSPTIKQSSLEEGVW
jgi:hypothetical protein